MMPPYLKQRVLAQDQVTGPGNMLCSLSRSVGQGCGHPRVRKDGWSTMVLG